ncbi:hypothetical protein HPB47_005239 [Ixodes persulcatus]|uniref:Uncharacterized protein n=1 Tax=Ixodes persulcatus TaxID=34615 RepID=A0AC60PDI4_IXOPE|nr:hypothetical protein HPB47_005239 [Ixodes persulcatus]
MTGEAGIVSHAGGSGFQGFLTRASVMRVRDSLCGHNANPELAAGQRAAGRAPPRRVVIAFVVRSLYKRDFVRSNNHTQKSTGHHEKNSVLALTGVSGAPRSRDRRDEPRDVSNKQQRNVQSSPPKEATDGPDPRRAPSPMQAA